MVARKLDVLLAAMAECDHVGPTTCGPRGRSCPASGLSLSDAGAVAVDSDEALGHDASPADVAHADLAAIGRDAEAWQAFTDSLLAYERATARLGYDRCTTTLEAFRHELSWVLSRMRLRDRAGSVWGPCDSWSAWRTSRPRSATLLT